MNQHVMRIVYGGCCGLLLLAFAACRESKTGSNAGPSSGSVSETSTIAEVADDPLPPEPGTVVLALDVRGMHCTSCAEGIGKALIKAEGVRRARVSFNNSCAWLWVDAGHHLSAEDAAGLVNGLGFKATPRPPGATSSQPSS